MSWFRHRDGNYIYSLRSRADSGIDVSAIAKKYGGGGHKNAAGFKLEYLILDERVRVHMQVKETLKIKVQS